jgi:hypothetical protein
VLPTITLVNIEHEARDHDRGAYIVAHLDLAGTRHRLFCEVKPSGQPRHVRMALIQLRNDIAHREPHATPVLIAPYLSHDAQAVCREQNVGFLDLSGNARLIFGVFRDTVEPAQGVICTSPVQTYLDLAIAGERGREAAEHLRHERLAWPT